MRVFIVHAHHEPTSFNAALTDTARAALLEAGHEVRVSDLYAMNFDPVSDRRNFCTVADGTRLKQQVEEELASAQQGFSPELQQEMDRLSWCDTLVLQFPLWWLGMPAIMKGWVDRVFALGRAYGGGRYYSRGVFAGKRAMCSVTIGGSRVMYSDRGAYGPIEAALFPIHHGILAFTGFTLLEPFLVFAPARASESQRRESLREYRAKILGVESAPASAPLDLTGFDGLVRRA